MRYSLNEVEVRRAEIAKSAKARIDYLVIVNR